MCFQEDGAGAHTYLVGATAVDVVRTTLRTMNIILILLEMTDAFPQ